MGKDRQRRAPDLAVNGQAPQVFPYGTHPSQFVLVYQPSAPYQASNKGVPIAVVVHGGFWADQWTVRNATHEHLAPFFASNGWAAVDIEYRRVGGDGGYPNSNEDVFAALQSLHPSLFPGVDIDLSSIVVFGHSAGGHLALCLAHECASKGARISPKLVVGLAPCVDLVKGAHMGLSDSGRAIQNFMTACGAISDDAPYEKYSVSSPQHLLPLRGSSQLLVAGTEDSIIPPNYVREYYDEAIARKLEGDGEVEWLELNGCDHFEMVNPKSEWWGQVWGAVTSLCNRKWAQETLSYK
eukprot:c52837_g1_i1.p1 GENE.c52837_g1_i1~~c52837_g1_i1.p1  ORF type:complete len:296 (-),score=50.02 c52837_g1_i1:15-902(-)